MWLACLKASKTNIHSQIGLTFKSKIKTIKKRIEVDVSILSKNSI